MMPDYIVIIIRSFISFFVLLIMARLMGKTQISQLTFFDYVVGITIGSITATASTQSTLLLTSALAGVLTWAGLKIFLDWITLKNIPLRKLLDGEPTVVIKNGKIMEEAMNRNNYHIDELMAQLRNLKIFDLSQVEEAVLELNGKLSVLPKSQNQPVTPQDLQINTKYKGMPQILIVDGNIAHHRLAEIGLNEDWLRQEISKSGVQDITEVMVAQLDTSGNLYVDKRSDWKGWR